MNAATTIKIDPAVELRAAQAVLREQVARIAELEAALERIAGIGEWTNNPVEVARAALAKGQA